MALPLGGPADVLTWRTWRPPLGLWSGGEDLEKKRPDLGRRAWEFYDRKSDASLLRRRLDRSGARLIRRMLDSDYTQ